MKYAMDFFRYSDRCRQIDDFIANRLLTGDLISMIRFYQRSLSVPVIICYNRPVQALEGRMIREYE